MSLLTDLRADLVTSLTGLDITTYSHMPGRMALPGVFVMAGSPYIEQGDTFASKLARFNLVLGIQTSSNQAETEALDELIESVQEAVETYDSPLTDGWVVESVAQPFAMSFNNTEGLVTEITVTAIVTFI